MASIGKPVSQLDGSAFAHSNCVLVNAKKLMELWSLGYWNPLTKNLRVASGDTSGGVTFSDAEKAAAQLSNNEVQLKHLYWAPASTMDDMLVAGKEFGVMISCAVTSSTPFRTGTYTGLHQITVFKKRIATLSDGSKQKQGRVLDPGRSTAKFVWWPWSLIVKASLAVSGGNGVHLLYGRDRTNVVRVAKSAGAIRSSAKVATSPSNVIGSFAAGASKTVVTTVDGGSYTLDGRTLTMWSKLGTGKYAVAKIR